MFALNFHSLSLFHFLKVRKTQSVGESLINNKTSEAQKAVKTLYWRTMNPWMKMEASKWWQAGKGEKEKIVG